MVPATYPSLSPWAVFSSIDDSAKARLTLTLCLTLTCTLSLSLSLTLPLTLTLTLTLTLPRRGSVGGTSSGAIEMGMTRGAEDCDRRGSDVCAEYLLQPANGARRARGRRRCLADAMDLCCDCVATV